MRKQDELGKFFGHGIPPCIISRGAALDRSYSHSTRTRTRQAKVLGTRSGYNFNARKWRPAKVIAVAYSVYTCNSFFSLGPIPEWTVREQLILASAVQRSGDQNWYGVHCARGRRTVCNMHSVATFCSQGVSQQSCETSCGRCKTSRLLLPKGTS